MSKPEKSPNRKFLNRLLAATIQKRDAEFPELIKKFFPDGAVTGREKELFDFAHGLGVAHTMEHLSETVTLLAKRPD